jgi:tetratricopeptide (TPR) repeat protein
VNIRTRQITRKIALALLASVWTACSSTQIALHTTPTQARVYAKSLGRGKLEYLGETPLYLKGEQLEKEYAGSGPVYLEFRKEGFKTGNTIVTELSYIDLNITTELTPESGFEDFTTVNILIDSMFECQRLVKVKRYDEALSRLTEVKRQAPQVSAVYELEGGIFYLQQRFQDALDSYRLAVKYNPRNAEALRMKNLIEDSFGLGRRGSNRVIGPDIVNPGPATETPPAQDGGKR